MYLAPPGKGRRPSPIVYGPPRPLTELDIASMWDGQGGGQKGVPRLKTLRYNHHLLAKAVASGKSLLECSQLSGLTGARISDLKNDPAFQELVSFYAEELNEVYVDVHQRMAALGTSVLEELTERFEADPDKFTKRELMDLFTTMADRSIATAKGGPSPQAGVTVASGGAGLALQINFVSPAPAEPETIEAKVVSGVLPGEGARSPGPVKFEMPPGIDIDGEPIVPHIPTPMPTQAEVAEVRNAEYDRQIAQRQADAEERERIYAEIMAKRARGE